MGIWDKIKSLFAPTQVEPKNITRPAAPRKSVGDPYQSDKLVNLNISQNTATPPPVVAPAKSISETRISYSVDLISTLEKDHQNLLQLFTSIVTSATNQQHAQAQTLLKTFKTNLLEHLHLENLKLYIYLQYSLNQAPEKFTEMRRFRKEMDVIGKVAMAFFDKYENTPLTANNHSDFLAELNHIGQVLGNRIIQEEKILYPMYRTNQT